MAAIKPIETIYKGYRFRSRLEARWAVFFDNVMVEYEYEPEGFVLEDGTMYLPDFYLPEIDAYVEVKSAGAIKISFDNGEVEFNSGREKAEKYFNTMAAIAKEHTYIIFQGDPANALLQQKDSFAHAFFMGNCTPGILSYDDPSVTCTNGKKCADCDSREQSFLCSMNIVGFTGQSIITLYCGDWLGILPVQCEKFDIVLVDKEGNKKLPTDMSEDELRCYLDVNCSAMQEARQARFEHGETPA